MKDVVEIKRLNRSGRKYFLNSRGEVTFIECAICHNVLPVTEFNKSHQHKTGHQAYCKECQVERNAEILARKFADKEQDMLVSMGLSPAQHHLLEQVFAGVYTATDFIKVVEYLENYLREIMGEGLE